MPAASSLGNRPAVPARATGPGEAARRVLRRPQFWFGATVLVPTLLFYAVFAFFPIARGLWLAVVDYDFIGRTTGGFVGLDNFRALLLNPLLLTAARNTVILGLVQFAVSIPLGLLVATCLVNIRRGQALYQGTIFLPVVVSLVAVALLFRMLMDPDVGQFNAILRALRLPTSQWLSGADSALLSIAAIDIWKGLGFLVVILAAGMMNIPTDLYDAARVDGVTEWQRFRYLTLPLLGHTLALVMVLGMIGSLQVYTGPVVLTNGGPGNATYVYNMLIVAEAFGNFRFGIAAAAAVLQFVAIFAITIVQLKLIRPTWSY